MSWTKLAAREIWRKKAVRQCNQLFGVLAESPPVRVRPWWKARHMCFITHEVIGGPSFGHGEWSRWSPSAFPPCILGLYVKCVWDLKINTNKCLLTCQWLLALTRLNQAYCPFLQNNNEMIQAVPAGLTSVYKEKDDHVIYKECDSVRKWSV